MPTTVFPNCPCCGPASGSGSGSGSGGRRRYTTCADCGRFPAALTVTYLDHGGATATMTGGGPGVEYIADAPSIPYLMGMYAQTSLGCPTGAEGWFFRGCTIDSTAPLEMLSCDPMILYGATPFGTVVITEDGSSPSLPSLGSLAPGCDGISGTLNVDVTGGPGCLTTPFTIVRVPPGVPVDCNYWSGDGDGSCGCAEGGAFTLACTAGGTWAATFAGVGLTLLAQTSSPFSLTFELPVAPECGTEVPAGTVFVVTEP